MWLVAALSGRVLFRSGLRKARFTASGSFFRDTVTASSFRLQGACLSLGVNGCALPDLFSMLVPVKYTGCRSSCHSFLPASRTPHKLAGFWVGVAPRGPGHMHGSPAPVRTGGTGRRRGQPSPQKARPKEAPWPRASRRARRRRTVSSLRTGNERLSVCCRR